MNLRFINYDIYKTISPVVHVLSISKEAKDYLIPYKRVVPAKILALKHKKKDHTIFRYFLLNECIYLSPQEVIYTKHNNKSFEYYVNRYKVGLDIEPEEEGIIPKPKPKPKFPFDLDAFDAAIARVNPPDIL